MSAAEPCSALASDRIDLIDEDDARRRLLRLFKEVTHARCADTDKHLNKIRSADRKELHARLTGNCLCKKRLARARRPKEQNPLRNPCPEFVEFIRRLQEFDHFFEFLLRLICPRNIGERHLFLVAHHQPHTRFSEVHHAPAAHLGLLHDKEPESNEDRNRDKRGQHRLPPRRLGRILRRDIDPLVRETRIEFLIAVRRIGRNGRELRPIRERAANVVLDEDDLVHLTRLHLRVEVTVAECRRLRRLMAARHIVGDRPHNKEHERIKRKISKD